MLCSSARAVAGLSCEPATMSVMAAIVSHLCLLALMNAEITPSVIRVPNPLSRWHRGHRNDIRPLTRPGARRCCLSVRVAKGGPACGRTAQNRLASHRLTSRVRVLVPAFGQQPRFVLAVPDPGERIA